MSPLCKNRAPSVRSCWESQGLCWIGLQELAATVRQDQEKRQQLLTEAEQTSGVTALPSSS